MPRSRPMLSLLAALSLGACGETDTLWGGESDAREAGRLAAEAAQSVQVPVETVSAVEIGRTRDGFLITAHGIAPGPGYALPTLRPRRGGAPGFDGYVEYDFVATEPPAGLDLPQGTARNRLLRADLPVGAGQLRGAAGVRVLGQTGGAQLDFRPAPPPNSG